MVTGPIVVGTDGSMTAERAIDQAGELALALGVVLHIVNSYATATASATLAATGGAPIPDVLVDKDARAREAAAEQIVGEAGDRLAARGVDVRTHIFTGDPARALMTVADNESAQMIVVGNRGMAGARRMLGSVPNTVSHNARCAVLIVPTR